MASFDSLRSFPVVKIVPVSMLDEEKPVTFANERMLGKMAAKALETLSDIERVSETENNQAMLSIKLRVLHGQLDRIMEYCK